MTAGNTQSKGTILFVHAHPDDESMSTGGAIARYVRTGYHVVVVTCTRGEQGKVEAPDLRHLAADQEDKLGDCRAAELRAALNELGVTDHRFLCGEGTFRDSGRFGDPANDRPGAFWQADVDQAAEWLADVIRETNAAVVVTYDQNGGYGHPDHIQSHRVTMRAIELLADTDPWVVRRVFWNAAPAEVVDVELAQLASHQSEIPNLSVEVSRADYDDSVHPMADITCELDVSADYEAKCKALAFHRSQVSVYGQYWVLATGKGMRILDKEWFIEIPGPGRQPPEFRRDLFEGLT